MPEYVKESRNYKVPDFVGNPNQEKAIMHTAGAAQVFAGPGSGKTYVIVHRIRQLITIQGIDPSHILVITFTKAAALEMQERFFRLTQPDRPSVRFGTFHAVFYHILKQSAQYRDYAIITESERKKLIRQIIHIHAKFACLQEEDLDELLTSISAYKATSVIKPLSVQKLKEEDIVFLVKEYEDYLREFKQMDFDDIFCYCHRLLTEHPEIRAYWQEQFHYILVDEFQDISPGQYEIVKLLAEPRNNLFIVGDDDQTIYGFRRASPDSMRDFIRDYPDASRIFLDINYRCSRQIVEVAGQVISENHNRVGKKIRAVHEDGEGFRLRIFESEAQKEECIIRELQERQCEGRLAQCAMICRTNYDCAMWAQSLYKNGIPFSMREALKDKFKHFVVRDIMAYLALAQGELFRKHFLRIMNRPVRYLKREAVPEERVCERELLAYYRYAPALQASVSKLFRELNGLRSRKPHLQIRYIRKVIGYDRYLKEKYGAEEARKLISVAAELEELSERFQTVADMNDYISQYGETLERIRDGRASEKCLQEKYPQEKCVQVKCIPEKAEEQTGIRLMTMHASKGLEFDTVYIPDCQEGKIPSAKAVSEEELEEERRMFYVAMTRAKRELCLMAHQSKTGKDAPSRFIKCIY